MKDIPFLMGTLHQLSHQNYAVEGTTIFFFVQELLKLHEVRWGFPPVLCWKCSAERTEKPGSRWQRCSVAVGRQSHTELARISREGVIPKLCQGTLLQSVTLIWSLLSRVHISVPIHKKQCKDLLTSLTDACWGHSSAALICFYFMFQAWLHDSRSCHTGTFQDRVKTISSLETGRVPRVGVKPREYWSVSCLCYDFCHVTQSHPPSSLSEPGQLSQQGMGCCSPHVSTASLQNPWQVFRLILPQNGWVLTTFTAKHQTEQRGGVQGAGGAPQSAATVCLSRRDIQGYKLSSLLLYGCKHSPLGKSHRKWVWHLRLLGGDSSFMSTSKMFKRLYVLKENRALSAHF